MLWRAHSPRAIRSPRAGTRLPMTAADSQRLLCYLERKPTARAPFPTAGGRPSSDQEATGTSVPRGGPGWLLGTERASMKAGPPGGPPSVLRCRPPLGGPALTCRVSQPPAQFSQSLWPRIILQLHCFRSGGYRGGPVTSDFQTEIHLPFQNMAALLRHEGE